MAGRGRTIGVVGFVFSVGIACTQLFGGEKNTLAPRQSAPPPVGVRPLQPDSTEPLTVCETGQMRCDGAQLQTCADDRSSWVTVQRCGAAALCQASPAMCLAATCSAEEMTCSGAVLQKCNADRTGWDLFATCLSPAHCNADLRQCSSDPCNPGDRRCDRSETDQSPVLEACRDDRADWAPLDACVSRELCDQTLTSGSAGGLVLGSDGMVQVQAPATSDTVLKCNLPACAVGEVRCDGAQLEFCSEGRTGWIVAEECASAALCSGSLQNVGASGTPVCLSPACAVGQHHCTEIGVLQLCSEDRTGFRDQETCIGAPFCNAVLADQGQAGCRDAPCEAGQMQCNGAQIQVCRDDRTALDDLGPPCESAALCNTDDPSNAVCDPPVCRRGATSGDEFHCEGALLQRCNESLTVYDTIQTCVTAALCDASQRFNGCKTPACQPGRHNCSNGFLQTCNADQTGFDNTENCGSQAQCDANAGRCADPCEPGATRCNQTTGDLELCRDRLTGWQPIADCPSLALCDAADGRCNICLSGEFSCADNQLRQCAGDGRTFARQNIPAECAAAPGGGAGVRGCQNNQVVVNPCPKGCNNGRCNECTGNETQCVGNGQIRRCVNGFFGNPTSCSDGNACNGVESCQNNNCVGGQAPRCDDDNPCTNDMCNPATGCQAPAAPNRTTCDPPSGTLETCTNGARQVTACGQLGCAPGSTICNNCGGTGQCNGNQFTPCNNGRAGAPVNCDDTNQCTNDSCSATGCQHGAVQNRAQCVNGDIQSCNNGNFSNQDCGANGCNPGSTSCNACTANTAPSCLANGQRRTCVNGQFQDRACDTGTTCQGGACVTNRLCQPGSFTACTTVNGVAGFNRCNAAGNSSTEFVSCNGATCNAAGGGCNAGPLCVANSTQRCQGTTPQRCNARGDDFDTLPACNGTIAARCENGNVATEACPEATPCQNGFCRCTPNAVISCSGTRVTTCNAAGTQAVVTTCPVNQSCATTNTALILGNAGPPLGCVTCNPNSRSCRGVSQLVTCNATGTEQTVTQCDAGFVCGVLSPIFGAQCIPG
jgi:hypothetical protein